MPHVDRMNQKHHACWLLQNRTLRWISRVMTDDVQRGRPFPACSRLPLGWSAPSCATKDLRKRSPITVDLVPVSGRG